MMDFDWYTAYLREPMVSKTSNPVEEYYRQTSLEKVKGNYKSPPGVMKYLGKRAGFWAVRHGLISAEASRFIGLKHMGKRFPEKGIERLFSDRKKHYLTYLATQSPMIRQPLFGKKLKYQDIYVY